MSSIHNQRPSTGIAPKYSLSSWNYGACYPSNPYYTKQQPNPVQSAPRPIELKRHLKEEEKIVTDEVLKNINDLKVMRGTNKATTDKMKRAKSSSSLHQRKTTDMNNTNNMNNSNSKQNENPNNNISMNSNKSIASKLHYQLSYDEWVEVKRQQQMIYQQIEMIKEEEKNKMELLNKNVNKKYKELNDKAFDEWNAKKAEEKRRKKMIIEEKARIEEAEKLEKEEEKKAGMKMWFQTQAKKMEEESRMKRDERQRKEMIEKDKEEEKMRKMAQSNEEYQKWLIKKGQEDYEKKMINKQMMKEKEMSQSNGSKKNMKNRSGTQGITIGPYTNAGALREIQKLINDNDFVNGEEDEEQDDEEEGNEGERQYAQRIEEDRNGERETEGDNNGQYENTKSEHTHEVANDMRDRRGDEEEYYDDDNEEEEGN